MALAGGMLAAGPLWWTRYEVVKRVNPVRYAEAAQPEETAPPTPQHTLAMEQRAA
ncbi:MAG: hypothetical protein MK101_08480 [Phycisphaerales bacterium]|nr:hypothetical protein [Phycisphaerales bacterium]